MLFFQGYAFFSPRYRDRRNRRNGLSNGNFHEDRSSFKARVSVKANVHDANGKEASSIASTVSGNSLQLNRFGNDWYINDFSTLKSDGRCIVEVGRQVTMARLKDMFRFRQGTTRTFGRLLTSGSNVPQDATNCSGGTSNARRLFLMVKRDKGNSHADIHVRTPARAITSTIKLIRSFFRRRIKRASFFRLPSVGNCDLYLVQALCVVRISGLRKDVYPRCNCFSIERVRRLVNMDRREDDVKDWRRLSLTCSSGWQAALTNDGGLIKVLAISRYGNVDASSFPRDWLGNNRRIRVSLLLSMTGRLRRRFHVNATLRNTTLNLRLFFRRDVVFSGPIICRYRVAILTTVQVNVCHAKLSVNNPAHVNSSRATKRVLPFNYPFRVNCFSRELVRVRLVDITRRNHSNAVVSTVLRTLRTFCRCQPDLSLSSVSCGSARIAFGLGVL